ncbi:hypothetical protein DQ384_27050 [Sphaerisporangium album]|uniref:Uncharacterized protein n=1 Tax=Sphaerisporangium album TaxID=509200 RepID=A0A367FAI1_9ACTN|nr:hypothetical protein DQ384_27050 [Sphaerisporangium album]
MTKHDVSVSSASLPKGWQTFAFKPDATTARKVAEELQSMRPGNAKTTMKLIADTLAERSSQERSEMSRLIMAELITDQARDFLKVTAATRLKHPTVLTPKDPTPQHLNPVHYLDVVEPSTKQRLPKTSKLGDPQLLNALDLSTADKRMVDLAAMEQHIDDESDASSMGHLKMAMKFVDDMNGGKGTYSEARRTALGPMVTDSTQQHLVDQIGFRTAPTQRNDKGLSAQNDLTSTYWRSTFAKTLPDFMKKLGTKVKIEDGDLLVNSPSVKKRLEMLVGKEVTDQLTIEPLQGTTGVSVLKGVRKLMRSDINWDSIMHELGAAPSAYQLYELMDLGKKEPPTNFKVDTRADLIALMTSSKFSRLQEMARSKGQLATVCAMVEHLVLGLTDENGPQRFDTLTASALNSMDRLLDIIVENERNPSAAMRAADLMMDEIGLVVAAAKNYVADDYRSTMRDITLERAPKIKPLVTRNEIQLESHLMSSGMDSLSTALYIALSTRDQDKVSRKTEGIDYFETGMLLDSLKKGKAVQPRDDVLIAALNPSSPFVAPSTENLVKDVRDAMKSRKKGDPPFALILDTTIQMAAKSTEDPTQLDAVLDGLKDLIADGSLEVFLCKSFQKYASFGTGKVAAGDLTMLSKRGNLASASARAKARIQEHDLDIAAHDEGQFIIHMLKHGHRDELALIDHAAENAKFVDEFCWPIEADYAKGSKYVDGIPLLLRSSPTGKVGKIFGRLAGVDQRDSFSFLRTSYVGGIPGPWPVPDTEGYYVRINTGHEPKEKMVENFYAFGHLAASLLPNGDKTDDPIDLDRLTPDTVIEHLDAVAIAAQSNPTAAQYQNNILASYCLFGFQNAYGPKPALVPAAIRVFGSSMTGVTLDTQRLLATSIFANLQSKHITADPTALAGLCNAAIVLPAWQFKPIAAKLAKDAKSQLEAMGDSDQAKLLREIISRANK